MTREDTSSAAGEFYRAMTYRNDLDEAREVLKKNPQIATTLRDSAFLMDSAAINGKTQFVALLHEFGVDVNIPRSIDVPERPISSAAMRGEAGTVRWLIEHGSDINYGWDGDLPHCGPLFYAIHAKSLETVRVLVEAGADLVAKNRNNLTPLDLSSALGTQEIVDYLRSKGAKRSSELPGYVPPLPQPETHIVVQYAATTLGFAVPARFTPESDSSPVSLHAYGSETLCCLFTQGMSERAMVAPPDSEDADGYLFAELVVPMLFEHWPEGSWDRPEDRWVPEWMLRVARRPFETGTWLGGHWGIISNEDPPEPLSAFTTMTCWLLLAEKGPLKRFNRDDGSSVVFYTMLPIHTAERDFALREGIVPLLQKFADQDVPATLTPERPSIV